MVSEGQFVGLDWNRIARLHSQVLVSTCENSLTRVVIYNRISSIYRGYCTLPKKQISWVVYQYDLGRNIQDKGVAAFNVLMV